jgi:hypothetical protein
MKVGDAYRAVGQVAEENTAPLRQGLTLVPISAQLELFCPTV